MLDDTTLTILRAALNGEISGRPLDNSGRLLQEIVAIAGQVMFLRQCDGALTEIPMVEAFVKDDRIILREREDKDHELWSIGISKKIARSG